MLTKIDKADYSGKGVIGLPDAPQLSTTSMQEKFEEISTDVIIPKFNNLVDELEGISGASNIGTKNGNVQSDIDAFDGKVAAFNGDISQLKSDMTTAQNDISTLKTITSANKTDITGLQSDNATNKSDISTIKANISSLDSDNTTNKANISRNATDINTLKTSVSQNANNITSLQSDNTTNKSDISALKTDNISLKSKAHTHSNKSVIDALSKDASTGDLMFEGNPIKGGVGSSDAYGHVKVGSVMLDASGDDTIELIAGSNVTLSANTADKSVTINAAGGGGTSTGDMLKSEFVLPGGTGQVLSAKEADHATNADNALNATNATNADNAASATVAADATHATNADNATHATNADNVGSADTSVLEAFNSQSDGLHYHTNRILYDVDLLFNAYNANHFKITRSGLNGLLELADAITTKLAKSVPTSSDEGKAPVVQSNGTVEWQKVSGSGTARIDIIHTADDVYYYNLNEPTKHILVTGNSLDVGFGTYFFYQTDGSQKSEEQKVVVDTLKIYSVELSYFTAYITVNYPSYAKCLLTKGSTNINASNGVATAVPSDGVWSVKVYVTNTAGEEVVGETSTVTITTDGQSELLTLNGLAKINLTWLSGFDSAITIVNSAESVTYNGLLSGASIVIPVNYLGDWIIYGTHTGKQYKAKVTINSFGEEKSVYLKTSTTYAVHINMAESDPDSAVTFPSGYDNSAFSDNAYMDFSAGSFHYGNWADAFFMPRSCMLKYDGTVDYYLNEDDETKKEDGTNSDVANINYGGNAMVEWGKIYFGFKGDSDGNGYTFIVSDYPDDGLDCYCNVDVNGNEIDHFYTPKYFGSNDTSNRLRSISGQSNYVSQTGTTELSHAKANGDGWSTECYGDWTLIKHLLVLMSKSLDTQGKYGYGRCATSNTSAIGQGTMNGKGRFWGDSSQTNGVKVFGMENWWGDIWRRIEGYVTNSSGVQLVKMCYGRRDGSTADGYSTGGTGYVSMGVTSGASASGIQNMHINEKCGVVPKTLTGNTSPATYFADGHWYGNSCYAIVGGSWNDGLRVGAFCSGVIGAVSDTNAYFGAAVSCKPLSA